VVQNEPDMSKAQRQLLHAKEQLDLTKQYSRPKGGYSTANKRDQRSEYSKILPDVCR
jgi:hypothetical protein